MAREIVFNAKMRRTGICGATETVLVDRAIAPSLVPALVDDLTGAGCEVRGDEAAQALDRRGVPAGEEDWVTEYLDAILALRHLDGIDPATAHLHTHDRTRGAWGKCVTTWRYRGAAV